jgi:CBS domain-containing protein
MNESFNPAVPLLALDAVGIDTETTGLDVRRDRIVQLGSVAISAGAVVSNETVEILVNPHVAVPPSSTAIHGITNAMVAGAPNFAQAWATFSRFTAGRVLVGHSIGFDLAVLAAEAGRAGIAWQRPRALCVRLLGGIANPRLPDQSLDTQAAWLGITITDRHSALGDALAAASIFVGLIPHLAARGIRTLAEAERACLELTALLERDSPTGWSEPSARPDVQHGFGNVDPYAYSHRVRELMSSPPMTIEANRSLGEAIKAMDAGQVSALFVHDEGAGGARVAEYGIVTERDMMRHLAANGAEALATPVGKAATRPVASIAAGAFVYRAVGRMERLNIRHLAVRDENERLVGVISARDLLRLRGSAAIKLDDAIAHAPSAAMMARAWADLPTMSLALLAEEIDARTIAGIVSEELRVATRRAGELAAQKMQADGKGPAPCPYAVLVLGSGGRGESLLAADQDNAIVFADGAPPAADEWFAEFAALMCQILDVTGVPFCKGGVMAQNAQWRGSLFEWQARVSDWVRRSRPADLLNVDIFFDMRAAHGDHGLAARLFSDAYRIGETMPTFTAALGAQMESLAAPVNFLGRIRVVDGRIDLKRHCLFPLVAGARALAIRHGIRRRSTPGRLRGLIEKGVGNEGEITRMIEAHAFVLSLMLAQQGKDMAAGIAVSNKIDPSDLAPDHYQRLKAVLQICAGVPDFVRGLILRG